MLSIKNNIMADNAARHLGRSYSTLAKSVERLASGLRINSAKDDAAGLAVRELIRADVAVFGQASRNAMDGISMLQTSEGALAALDEILVRMAELAEQGSTDSYSPEQRTIMNSEFAELSAEITRIAQATKFNEMELLNSTTAIDIHLGSGKLTITPQVMDASTLGIETTLGTAEIWMSKVGVASADDNFVAVAASNNRFFYEIKDSDNGDAVVKTIDIDWAAENGNTKSLNWAVQQINDDDGVDWAMAKAEYDSTYGVYRLKLTAHATGDNFYFAVNGSHDVSELEAADFTETLGADGTASSLLSAAGAQSALTAVMAAIGTKDSYRARLGYWMNRLEVASTVLDIQVENLSAAESRISDADVASEMAAMTRNQVLAQAGIAMLGQANMMPQMALNLLG